MPKVHLPLLMAAAVVASLPALAGSETYMDRNRIVEGLAPIAGDETSVARSLNLQVNFALGSARLTAEARRQLDALAAALQDQRLRDDRFGVYGHTDARGDAAMNLELSRARAVAVRDYLVDSHELRASRLDVKGFGERKLLDADNPKAAKNRRVEVVNLTTLPDTNDRDTPKANDDGGGTTAITGD